MLCNELFEDANADLSSVAKAQRWAYLFFDWMDKHNSKTPLGDIQNLRRLSSIQISSKKNIDILYIPGNEISKDIPSDINFGVGWSSKEDNTTRAYCIQMRIDNKQETFAILMLNKNPTMDTDVIYGTKISSLVHEIIHYFDYQRGYYNAVMRQRTSTKKTKLDLKKPRIYYNSPIEFNAHFNQLLADIFISLSAFIAQKKYYPNENIDDIPWLASFNLFYKNFESISNRTKYQFLLHLSNTNKKKIIKRLYKIYYLIKEQYPNIPEIQKQAESFIQNWTERDKND